MSYLLLLLPIESLFYYIGLPVQSFWLLNFIALVMAPFLLPRVFRGKVGRFVGAVLLGYFFLSLFSLLLQGIIKDIDPFNGLRVQSIIRTTISLLLGYLTFLLFQYLFSRTSVEKIISLIFYSFIGVFVLSLVQVVLVGGRATGFIFTEPSHLAEYSVFIMMPLLLFQVIYFNRLNLLSKVTALMVALVFVLSLSGTGIIRLGCLGLGVVLFSNYRKYGIMLAIALSCFLAYLMLFSAENNYAKLMILSAFNGINGAGEQSASVIDRGVLFFIFDYFLKPENWIGLGLAAESSEFAMFIPEDVLPVIQDVKQFNFSLSSVSAKMLVSTGVVGLFLYYFVFWRGVFTICNQQQSSKILKPIFFGMAAYTLIGLPVFNDIYIWFWLAFLGKLIETHSSESGGRSL
ncbi:hypothetical protein [Shewanella xiamenensis]|uniref:hypothetical protein n=1 Tax=Shewanella xiamenensis TaxID=332186 RepID=UPI00217F17F0|nr:hypothetical protein [Shewanella xiamenensis]MCT8872434.1 hypothetical protein [Shewanella xiamenensis]UWH43429.1 hypothetical protein KXJ80_09370 [Shewanella xiamenensis]